jgi:hypothetical protein
VIDVLVLPVAGHNVSAVTLSAPLEDMEIITVLHVASDPLVPPSIVILPTRASPEYMNSSLLRNQSLYPCFSI